MTLDIEAIRKRVRRAQVYGLPEAAKPVLAEDVPALLAEVERLGTIIERAKAQNAVPFEAWDNPRNIALAMARVLDGEL